MYWDIKGIKGKWVNKAYWEFEGNKKLAIEKIEIK